MKKNESQKKIFLASEGNRYFERNLGKADPFSADRVAIYQKHLRKGFKVLEIGCSFGANLELLSKSQSCTCYGIDPSKKAIQFGKSKYPSFHLSVSTADQLDFPDDFFDFVIFGFCLYLVDRKALSKAISEADRVLKDRGFLGVTDFDAKFPKRRIYKHCTGVTSYKMSYHDLFLAFPHFSLVEKRAFSHNSCDFVQDIKERLCSVVLFKNHESAYSEEKDF